MYTSMKLNNATDFLKYLLNVYQIMLHLVDNQSIFLVSLSCPKEHLGSPWLSESHEVKGWGIGVTGKATKIQHSLSSLMFN